MNTSPEGKRLQETPDEGSKQIRSKGFPSESNFSEALYENDSGEKYRQTENRRGRDRLDP